MVCRFLNLVVAVRPGEVAGLLWSFTYFFALLCGYYVLRPVRDEMGVTAGVANLPWLFTATFAAMLLAAPPYGWLCARWPRRVFLPAVYLFFMANLLGFYVWFRSAGGTAIPAAAFFVWVSVFNLFVVSVFWSFMADLFRAEQARRLYGFIAAGGSAGAIVGPAVAGLLAVPIGPVNLLLVSVGLLGLALVSILALLRARPDGVDLTADASDRSPPLGGGPFDGFALLLRSPYLMGIGLYLLLYTTTSTFLYLQQAEIVAGASDDAGMRTRFFALIDMSVGVATIFIQLCLTGGAMRRFGVAGCLAVAPLVTVAGFALIAAAPTVIAMTIVQAARRSLHFALSNPAREVLFTVVGREAKYKSKNVLDTVVYRGGDAASGWFFAGLKALGLGLAATAVVGLPLAVMWTFVGIALGRRATRPMPEVNG